MRNETQRGKEILERNKQCQKMTTNKSQTRKTHTVNEICQTLAKITKTLTHQETKFATKIKNKR